jgi:acyl-coenzyme A synthetase/AMP-(fatty) acid ligase
MGDVPQRVQALLEECTRPDARAAWLLCDRHDADAVAITLIEEDLSASDISYGELRELSERAAAGLAELGIEPGDRVASLMGKSRELLATMLGAWRLGAVYVPLFTAFGPKAVEMPLTDTEAKVVVDADQRPKLDPGPDMPADADWQIVLNGGESAGDDRSLAELLASEPHAADAYAGGGDHPFVHMLTSGTTGRPKGVVHPLAYVAGFLVYQEYSLDLRPDDVFWLSADPDGSMGQAMPGWTLVVLQEEADEPGAARHARAACGRHPRSPLMTFERYQHETGTSAKITPDGRWYLTGDAARQDADGDIFVSARDDDVIIMAGYRIGPFDVESVLAQHEAVAECAVIAVPDEVRGR